MNFDEGFELAKAHSVREGYELYTTVWSDHPPFHNLMLQALYLATGESVLAARLLAAAFSALLLGCFVSLCHKGGRFLLALLALMIFLGVGEFLPLSTAAIIIVPAYAMALVSVLGCVWAMERSSRFGLLLAGLAMGLGIMTKFTAALLFPLVVILLGPGSHRLRETRSGESEARTLEGAGNITNDAMPCLPPSFQLSLWLAEWRSRTAWRSASRRFAWWLAGMALAVTGIIALVPEMLSGQLFSPHFGRGSRELFGQMPNEMWMMLGDDWGLVLLAFYGAIRSVELGRIREVLLPSVWILTSLAAHALQKPFWGYYYFHLVLPLSWLAALGLCHGWSAVRELGWQRGSERRAWQLVDAGVLCACLVNLLPTAIQQVPLEIAHLTRGKEDPDWLIVRAMEAFKPATRWVYVERPVYAAVAGLAMPPELSVVTPKRFASGGLTETELVDILVRYQPEQLLIYRQPSERRTELLKRFASTHTIRAKFTGYELWVKADLVAAGRRAGLPPLSPPSAVASMKPNSPARP